MSSDSKEETFLGVFGHVNVDRLIDTTTDPQKEEGPYFGGVGGNIAVGAARFGVPVAISSIVGGDFPPDYMDRFLYLGIDTKYLEMDDGAKTSICTLVSGPNGHQNKVMFDGPQNDDYRTPPDFVIGKRYIHIATGFPHPCMWLARTAFSAGCQVVFDPGADLVRHYNSTFLLSILKFADIVFFNQEEMRIALKFLEIDRAEGLMDLVDFAIITKGEEGSELLTRNGIFEIPSVPPPVLVDATGAGDAYRAGFYAGLYRALPLQDCCYLGSISASRCVSLKGAQRGIGSWKELKGTFDEIRQ